MVIDERIQEDAATWATKVAQFAELPNQSAYLGLALFMPSLRNDLRPSPVSFLIFRRPRGSGHIRAKISVKDFDLLLIRRE
jgi:hypothetical protein